MAQRLTNRSTLPRSAATSRSCAREVHGKPLVYLDNAATSQKPRQVIQALVDYYEGTNANIHRGVHALAEEATDAYEGARRKVARFIGADSPDEILFTRNTTESLNLVAYTWAADNIGAGRRDRHHDDGAPLQHRALAVGGRATGRRAQMGRVRPGRHASTLPTSSAW